MLPKLISLVFTLGLAFGIQGCARRVQQAQVLSGAPHSIAELWQQPV
jgi:hypothetical protein